MILFVAIGLADRQSRFDDAALLMGEELTVGSVYRLLAEHGDQLFGDEYFAHLFASSRLGRATVAARVVAAVMLLQSYEGLSDREACDRLAFDLRWKAAAGIADGSGSFHPTVLVGMRNRLRASDRPRRLFEDVNATARAAGLLTGRRRVLDSAPLLDAVATQDTVTQLRAAIRTLLTTADREQVELAGAVRAVLVGDDEYETVGKPPCEWDDKAARDELVDALVRDANAAVTVLHDRQVSGPLREAAELRALVAGQDVEQGEDRVFRIARRVARDRVISTVDTQARHGHTSRARTFDGYTAHLAIDADDELITNVAVTPANAADRDALEDLLAEPDPSSGTDDGGGRSAPVTVFGDLAYADGATLDKLAQAGHEVFAKIPRYATPRATPKTSSSSTLPPARCRAQPGTPRRSALDAPAAGWPASHSGAQAARCLRPARAHDPGG